MKLVYANNAGATTTAKLGEVVYQPDKYFTGGGVYATTDPIAGVAEYAVYQTTRYGSTTYQVPVTNATYSAVLHFVEIFHNAAGARSFTVTVEGQNVLSNIDLYSLVGHDGALEYLVDDIVVRDGALTITTTTVLENSTISGFAIYSDSGGRLTQ